MKIQCDVCERAEAAVLCCADEAALCWACDEKVHAANKLAGKHERVPLLLPSASSGASKTPFCDICQEKAGYFFCLEDRALLCRQCDVTIHSASPFVSYHQRFLVTGVRVALQHYPTDNSNSSRSSTAPNELSNSSGSVDNSSNPPGSLPSNSINCNRKLQMASASLGVEKTEGFKPHWPWNDILEGVDYDRCCGLSEPGSSS